MSNRGVDGSSIEAYIWSDGDAYTTPEPLEHKELFEFYRLAMHYIPRSTQEVQRDKIEPIERRLNHLEKAARCGARSQQHDESVGLSQQE